MTAFLSDDDGATWTDGLLLDERESSYPDGVQAPDCTIYVMICVYARDSARPHVAETQRRKVRVQRGPIVTGGAIVR